MANLKQAFEYASQNPTSDFAKNLEQMASSGALDGEAKKYGIDLSPFKPVQPEPSLGQKLLQTGKETLGGVKETLGRVATGETTKESGALQAVGQVAGGALQATGDVLTSTPVVKDVISTVAKPVSQGIQAFQGWLENNPTFQKVVTTDVADKIASVLDANPDLARNAEAINNIANAVLVAKGGVQTAGKVVSGAGKVVDGVVGGAKAVAESPIVQGVADVTKMAGESVKRIPSRIATNVAEKQAQEMAIKSLPTPKAQVAVRDGIDILDVQNLPNIAKGTQAQKLIQTVKDFAQGKTKTDPIEVVGQPMIQRVKELNKTKEAVGKKLDDVAKNLGTVTKPELTNGVFLALEKVSGLKGLKLTPKGSLDFSNTTLANSLRKADRVAIQKAFTDATRWGDGLKAHKMRQSLFETLGGKKKNLANTLTDTEEQALNAIRKGLSDVLETKNNSYKTLSNEYRKIVQPLGDLRKLMKNIDPNSTEDILDMSAGLLARRITSAASSNPQIKQLLQALDKAGKGGNLKQGIAELQDLYNTLNKYYDIAPKTGFQNLVKEGVGVSDSLVGTIKETARDVAGRSNAVRQKALEDYLEELLTKSR